MSMLFMHNLLLIAFYQHVLLFAREIKVPTRTQHLAFDQQYTFLKYDVLFTIKKAVKVWMI